MSGDNDGLSGDAVALSVGPRLAVAGVPRDAVAGTTAAQAAVAAGRTAAALDALVG